MWWFHFSWTSRSFFWRSRIFRGDFPWGSNLQWGAEAMCKACWEWMSSTWLSAVFRALGVDWGTVIDWASWWDYDWLIEWFIDWLSDWLIDYDWSKRSKLMIDQLRWFIMVRYCPSFKEEWVGVSPEMIPIMKVSMVVSEDRAVYGLKDHPFLDDHQRAGNYQSGKNYF